MKKAFVILLLTALLLCLIPSNASAAEQMPDTNTVSLPILMYHSVLKSKSGTYIVSPAQLEQDFKRIVDKGYTSVTTQQIVDYVDGKGALPPKPILITFDDGHYNNIYYAKPLLEKYGLKALINVIGKFSDFTTASGDTGNVFEIGNHTYNMHNYKPRFGISQKCGETDEQYVRALQSDIGKLQKILFENTGKQCKVLAYPFGKYNQLAEKTLENMGFRIMLTCNEGVSCIKKGEKQSLYKLKRINRSGLYDVDTVFAKIENIK